MNYAGGSNPGTYRTIEPLEWIKGNKTRFHAICVSSKLQKEYKIESVLDIKYPLDQNDSGSNVDAASNL